MLAELTPTQRTTPKRKRDRVGYDVAALHEILDEALLCHVSYVVDGHPTMIPTLHARIGNDLYVHSSTGSTLALQARGASADIAVAVTLMDGIIYARSSFNHSANYRSAVIHGDATLVLDLAERERVLNAFVERFSPGRSAQLRASTADEIAQTAVVRLALEEASVKVRSGGVVDELSDMRARVWAGVLPLRVAAGDLVPDSDEAAGYALPALPAALRAGDRPA